MSIAETRKKNDEIITKNLDRIFFISTLIFSFYVVCAKDFSDYVKKGKVIYHTLTIIYFILSCFVYLFFCILKQKHHDKIMKKSSSNKELDNEGLQELLKDMMESMGFSLMQKKEGSDPEEYKLKINIDENVYLNCSNKGEVRYSNYFYILFLLFTLYICICICILAYNSSYFDSVKNFLFFNTIQKCYG